MHCVRGQFQRKRRTETINCSRDYPLEEKDSVTFQLEDLVVIPRHDSFRMIIALEYSPIYLRSFFVKLFDRANCSLVSNVSKIAISSAVLAWRTGFRSGVFLGAHLGFTGTYPGFLVSVALTNSVNDCPLNAAMFMTAVRSSATDAIVFNESSERSDMVRFKSYD